MKCDLCEVETKIYIDGRMKGKTMWANMCPTCHFFEGVGLGTGKGQKWKEKKDGTTVKLEG
jgi:hypothetical protein